MKYTFTLLSLFITLQVFGQADLSKYEDIVKGMAQYGATPFTLDLQKISRAGVDVTHRLDSIVNKNAASNTTDVQVMEYNADGTTNKIDQYGLDSATSVLQLQSTYTFTYAGSELPATVLVKALNTETQVFEDALGIELFYDGADRVDTSVVSIPDPLSGDFGPVLSLKYVYDGDNLIQSRQWFYLAFLGSWIPASITDFQYDGMDRLIDQQTSLVDFMTGDVVPDSRSTYSYNAQGLEDTVNMFLWVDPSWLPSQRYAMDYYANENIANEYDQVYNGAIFLNNGWTNYPVENIDDEYPVNYYFWDLPGNSYVLVDSSNTLLNPALTWNNVAAPTELAVLAVLGEIDIDIAFFSDGPVTDEVHYFLADSLSGNLVSAGKDFFYYSLFDGTSVAQILPEYLSVTPNPAQGQFTISIDQNVKADYVVYASNGMEKARGLAQQGTNNIQTSSWPQGLYYVIITLEDGSTYAHKQLIH